jgi:hypothetical protein
VIPKFKFCVSFSRRPTGTCHSTRIEIRGSSPRSKRLHWQKWSSISRDICTGHLFCSTSWHSQSRSPFLFLDRHQIVITPQWFLNSSSAYPIEIRGSSPRSKRLHWQKWSSISRDICTGHLWSAKSSRIQSSQVWSWRKVGRKGKMFEVTHPNLHGVLVLLHSTPLHLQLGLRKYPWLW